MRNPYTARLEELEAVIRKRVALRQILRCGAYSGDALDQLRSAEAAKRELAWCQREYERLHHELGRPLPHPGPVKLDTAAVTRAKPVVKVTPARRTVPGGILTRMIGGPGCR
jgi:hypothetical protein